MAIRRARSWAEFDFAAYASADHSPPPALCRLPDADFILSGWGGQRTPLDEQRETEHAERRRLQ